MPPRTPSAAVATVAARVTRSRSRATAPSSETGTPDVKPATTVATATAENAATKPRAAAKSKATKGDEPTADVKTEQENGKTTTKKKGADTDQDKPSPAKKRKVAAPPTFPPPPSRPRTPPPPVNLAHAISHLSGVDARFGPLFARIPCKPFHGEIPLSIDPFRTLVTSIIGQQVSWMAARSITKRFVEHFCGPGVGERYDSDGPFPTRHQVAAAEVMALKGVGCSTRKAEYLIELAQHFVKGNLSDSLLLNGSDEEVAAALIAVRGIGRWTVDMFLIFTLRRPDVLPVGDLGVQKGLLRWVLAAHGGLPPSAPRTPKGKKKPASDAADHTPTDYGGAGIAPSTPTTPAGLQSQSQTLTATATATPLTPAPSTATLKDSPYVLVTPKSSALAGASSLTAFPSTPGPPPLTPSASANPNPANNLPAPAPDSILCTPEGWDDACAHRAAPLPEGLSVGILKSRLAGKKAKGGAYLLPAEMEALTDAWRPYRSLGTYYTWSMAGETG